MVLYRAGKLKQGFKIESTQPTKFNHLKHIIMRTFNGQPISAQKQPLPKVNQIWEDKTGKLLKVTAIVNNIQASIEYADGQKAMIGFGWFDGITYTFV